LTGNAKAMVWVQGEGKSWCDDEQSGALHCQLDELDVGFWHFADCLLLGVKRTWWGPHLNVCL
jgi:hypothetical protein